MPRTLASSAERVGLSWLVTVRWASIAAGAAAVAVGERALGVAPPGWIVAALVAAGAASNLWLTWRERRASPPPEIVPALLVCADVVVLSVLLSMSGGAANAVSIFFLVHIVLAALVLGSGWTWGVTALCIGGYGALYLTHLPELSVAQEMHPTIDRHITGMWWAFAATALLVATLVARLAAAVRRRDQALVALRESTHRSSRLAGLATLAAGAAHELSTPLGTIAVTARELERAIERLPEGVTLREDVALIRGELGRCRAILDGLAGSAGQPAGEMPLSVRSGELIDRVRAELSPGERTRLRAPDGPGVQVVWPVAAMTRAVANLVRNGLQASPPGSEVALEVEKRAADLVELTVVDHGSGLPPEVAGRVGEPFFTTKPEGQGLGLGVFVARSTVERLGGSLTFTSEPGRGSRVRIVLPRTVVGGARGAAGEVA